MKIRSCYTYDPDEQQYEENTLPSETCPDQSFTVRELLARFTSGTMPPVSREGNYDEDPEFDTFDDSQRNDLELVDVYHLYDENEALKRTKMAQHEKEISEKQKSLEKKKLREELEAERSQKSDADALPKLQKE